MKPIETKSSVLLQHHLKALRLPTMHDECEKLATRCAQEQVDHLAFLLQLYELELLDREKRSAQRRLRSARFPNYKTLDDFQFASQPSLNRLDSASVSSPSTNRIRLRLLEAISLRALRTLGSTLANVHGVGSGEARERFAAARPQSFPRLAKVSLATLTIVRTV